MHKLTMLIKEDMKPALGVTEPGAIAFAAATARDYVPGDIKSVRISLNSGMYKNAFSCGIPNSNEVGNVYAAALGAVAGNAGQGLEALRDVKPQDNEDAEKLVSSGAVKVLLDHIGSEITIEAEVETTTGCCTVRIAGSHTNIISIVKNGEVVYDKKDGCPELETKETGAQPRVPVIHTCTLDALLVYINAVPVSELAFIKEAFSMNMELLKEGLESGKTTFVHQLWRENGEQLISRDALRTAQLLSNGAIEARVLGLSKPAMSITGSGAHGIIATLPLYAWQQVNSGQVSEEQLLRAIALSYLITMYIKEYSGRLSAFCGCGIAAGTGMACGLCYLQEGLKEQMTKVIQNMASGITGMICDGGNQGCVMKGIVAVDAAFRAVDMAIAGICVENMHGINGETPEDTMKNMGKIASPGMVRTEETILGIMESRLVQKGM